MVEGLRGLGGGGRPGRKLDRRLVVGVGGGMTEGSNPFLCFTPHAVGCAFYSKQFVWVFEANVINNNIFHILAGLNVLIERQKQKTAGESSSKAKGNFCVQQYGTVNLLWQWFDETVDVLIKLAIHVCVLLLYVLTEVFAWTVWLWKGKLMGLPPIRTPIYTPSKKGGGLADLSLEWPPFSSSQVLHVLFFYPTKGVLYLCLCQCVLCTVSFDDENVHKLTSQTKCEFSYPFHSVSQIHQNANEQKSPSSVFPIFELLLFAVVKASSDVEEEYEFSGERKCRHMSVHCGHWGLLLYLAYGKCWFLSFCFTNAIVSCDFPTMWLFHSVHNL